MRLLLPIAARAFRIPGAAALAVLLSCQGHDFEPVEPKTIVAKTDTHTITGAPLPPKVMLVVDRSGSMKDDGKWAALQTAFADAQTGLLTTAKDLAVFGLAVFPDPSADGKKQGTCCDGSANCCPGVVNVALGTSPGDTTEDIRNLLLNVITPVGGTPTTKTLQNVLEEFARQPREPNRQRLVMLLTDGLPNCNPAFSDPCNGCVGQCVSCTSTGTSTCTAQPFYGAGCLDDTELTSAVRSLKSQDISTFVIGFGTSLATTTATTVLNAAAVAGGLARPDPDHRFYAATNLMELEGAVAEFVRVFRPCTFTLDYQPSQGLLEVAWVNGNDPEAPEEVWAEGSDWSFDPATKQVTVLGARCAQVQSDQAVGYSLSFRYVVSR